MRIEAGIRMHLEGGATASFLPNALPKDLEPGQTATHESTHGVVAIRTGTEVKSMTINSTSEYLGLTELTGFNAAAALAPHAMGMSGTSHDVYVATFMGAGGAGEAGKAVARANQKEIRAVAVALEKNKTLSSSEIHRAMDEANHPLPLSGTIYIENADGEKLQVKGEVRDNVLVPENSFESFIKKPFIQ